MSSSQACGCSELWLTRGTMGDLDCQPANTSTGRSAQHLMLHVHAAFHKYSFLTVCRTSESTTPASPPTYPLPSTPTHTRVGSRELAKKGTAETDWEMKEPKQRKPALAQNCISSVFRPCEMRYLAKAMEGGRPLE
jgi:hypothetical protein